MQQKFSIKPTLFGLFVLAACSAPLGADEPQDAADQNLETSRPNILLLYADDWRHDSLGCAGNPVVETPNLDRLATEGMRFTDAYVTTSICGVSRATLFTGQWMSRHGNRGFAPFDTPWAETYPGLLRAEDYWVGHIGKWHNGRFPKEEFDFGRSYAGAHWMRRPDKKPIHVTQRNEDDALEFLRTRPRDRPFCLTLAFFAPHAQDDHPQQYLPQPESESLYQDVEIPVPPNASEAHLRKLPPFIASDKNEGRRRWRKRFDTPEKYQTYMKNYYRLVSEVDATCGRVLEQLREDGVLDETLVIFTCDNGYFHGERRLADKWYPYQESIRVPLIVRDPRLPAAERGRTNEAMVLNVDLAPTILAAVGVEPPQRMQGRDMSPLYLAEKPPRWREEFFYEHPTIHSRDFIPESQALVRNDAKYILWPEFDYEELYDLEADPLEEHNLVRDPDHSEQLASMRKRFEELKNKAR